MSIEAMKQALRVLENTRECDAVNEAITSLRQAIAEAKKQEPVAWWIPKAEQFCLPSSDGTRPFAKAWNPLYTTPQQRTWVGLTDEELKPICDENYIMLGAYAVDFIRAIEAKLKEKNT